MSAILKPNRYSIINSKTIKLFLFVFAIFVLIAPFTGYIELQRRIYTYIQSNFTNFEGLDSTFNPLFLALEVLSYQISVLIEFLFPKLWGINNYFFLRFFLKIPLFIFYFISAIVVRNIIQEHFNNKDLSDLAFYLQLFNLPLIYSTFILGSPESIAIFFIFAGYYLMVKMNKMDHHENKILLYSFLSGFLFGISITFTFFAFIFVPLFFHLFSYKKSFYHILGVILSFLLVKLPTIFFTSLLAQPLNPSLFGLSNLLLLFNVTGLDLFFMAINTVLVLFIIFYLNQSSSYKILMICIITLILSVNLTNGDFVIILSILIITLPEFLQVEEGFEFNKKQFLKFFSIALLTIFFACFVIFTGYYFFLFKVDDIFYIFIIQRGLLGKINNNFWQTTKILEFNSLIYILFVILLTLMAFLVQKKRNIFNIKENS